MERIHIENRKQNKTSSYLYRTVLIYNMLMTRRTYTVIYEEDPEGGFVASVPSLPGCYSQGDTLEETQKNITEAIELYLETLSNEKNDIPEEHLWQGHVEVAI